MLDWISKSIIIDCETTGLEPGFDQIIELSILDLADDSIQTWRANPYVEISREAYLVHRISKAELQNEPRFGEIVQKVLKTWNRAKAILGFNILFDYSMVVSELARMGVPCSSLDSVPLIDVKALLPSKCPRSLQYAYQYLLKSPPKCPHTSAGDVLMAKELFIHLLNFHKLRDSSLDNVIKFCSRKNYSLREKR